ncbi:MAG: carbon-nitrogen hydrolase family protein [Gammaproteobacteria bacterium]|nr:carbon-nitrogen hydrolase family protein [Gammaproteobacteria bacterium]
MNRVAAIQMASGPNVHANLIEAKKLIDSAVESGANLVVLPENFALMGQADSDMLAIREHYGSGPVQEFLSQQAAQHKIWLVGGTIPLVADDPDKVRAACVVFDDKGDCKARYDKIHLFDVHLPESEENYSESTTIEAAREVVVIDTPLGRMGVAICYDLRFPELFRLMLDQGVELFAIPSAFTAITGKAHWETLIRARAVENLCYVVAAAQGGFHVSGRETYGDSMVVDPWGVVLDRLSRGSGVVVTDIDHGLLESTRRNFPVIDHRRLPCSIGKD